MVFRTTTFLHVLNRVVNDGMGGAFSEICHDMPVSYSITQRVHVTMRGVVSICSTSVYVTEFM